MPSDSDTQSGLHIPFVVVLITLNRLVNFSIPTHCVLQLSVDSIVESKKKNVLKKEKITRVIGKKEAEGQEENSEQKKQNKGAIGSSKDLDCSQGCQLSLPAPDHVLHPGHWAYRALR